MKRFLIIALVALMAVTLLIGCKPAVYKDGTYTAHSDAGDKGDYSAEVTIKGDKITAVKIQGYNSLGVAKGADYVWAEYHQAVIELPKQFIAKNSTNVDTIAKATSTTKGAKQAVARAMEKALVKPTSTAKYFDGTFMAVSAADSRGGWTVAWVTIAGDKITAVDFHGTAAAKEKDAAGVVVKDAEGKDVIKKDAAGNTVFERKDPAVYGIAAGYTAYAEAKVELPKRIVEKNSPDVDVFTGATGTSTQLKEAVTKALALATRK